MLVTTLMGMFATAFPIVVLVASLGAIAEDLDTTESALAWVVAAPLLGAAVAMPVIGKVGDLHGHRRVFLVAFVLASATALLTATAFNALSLIGFRTLAHMAGTSAQPTAIALLGVVFAPRERVRAMGYWTSVIAGAPALGLVVGGPLIDAFGWRILFIFQSGLSAVAALGGWLILRETQRRPSSSFDIQGAVLLAVCSAAALFALNRSGPWGAGHPAVPGAVVFAVLAFWWFVRVERRAADPFLPLRFFRLRGFSLPISGEFFIQAANMGAFVITPLLLRSEFGYSVGATAFVLLPLPVSMTLSGPIGGRLSAAIGERATAVLGALSTMLAMVGYILGFQSQTLLLVLAALTAHGIGNGLARPPITATVTNSLGPEYFGAGTGMLRMLSQMGAAFGVTIFVLASETSGERTAFLVGAGLAVVAVGLLSMIRSMDRRPRATREGATTDAEPGSAPESP